MRIALELTPTRPSATTIYQPIYVTIPKEKEVVIGLVTVTTPQTIETTTIPYTVTVTQYHEVLSASPSYLITPVITTETIYTTEVSLRESTITYYATDTVTVTITETITLANYAEYNEVSTQIAISLGSEIIFNPNNNSINILSSLKTDTVNLLSLGVRDTLCKSCSLRLTRFGDIDALEIKPYQSEIAIEVNTSRTIDIDRGMLWIYFPKHSGISVKAIYLKIGDTIAHVSSELYRYHSSSSGVLFSIYSLYLYKVYQE